MRLRHSGVDDFACNGVQSQSKRTIGTKGCFPTEVRKGTHVGHRGVGQRLGGGIGDGARHVRHAIK
jgi:hypothetical protein